jgi:mercuric reductase
VSAPSLDLARTRAWKNSLIRPQESWVEVLRDAGYGVFPGEGTLVDARTVRVGDVELTAERVLIATGGRTAVPQIPGIDDVEWIDHVSALELEEVPTALLVVGGGPVGVELAQIFARFGSRVTVINHSPQIAARADAEAARELHAALEAEGIEIVDGTDVESFSRNSATLDGRTVDFSHVLLASGRTPNVEGLGLEGVGVEFSGAGIVVDEHQRTSVKGIWASGDVVAGPALTPVAQYQARIAVDDMFGNGSRTADYSVLPTAIFTDPELAGIGLTEDEARLHGYDVDVVRHALRAVTRAQYIAAQHGLYKVVFDRETRRVLGVHIVARGAGDIVAALAPALKLGATVDDLALAHHVYPSYAEGVKAAAEQALTSY